MSEHLVYNFDDDDDPRRKSYKEFKQACSETEIVDILTAIYDSFFPASVDPERLFTWGRLSKKYLQSKMFADTHSRNVFLNKIQLYLA